MAAHYLAYVPTFVLAAEKQSFSKAAKELGITKSAVSKHIQALEDALDARLINRTTRKLALTEEGRMFYEKCTSIIEDLEGAERMVQNLSENPRGVLKISAPESFGLFHLAPIIAEFAQKYPTLKLEVDFSDRFVDILAEGLDLAVRVASLTDSSLIARKLAPCQMVMAASPEYLKAKGTPQTPDDLANHDWIGYSYADRPREWRYFAQDGKEAVANINVKFRANNGQMLRQAALSGIGIISAPSFIIGNDVKKEKLVPILADYKHAPERNIYALFPHNRHMSAKVRIFVDFIADRFEGKPYWEV